MSELKKLFAGSQDIYMGGLLNNPLTLETEYIDTIKEVLQGGPGKQECIPFQRHATEKTEDIEHLGWTGLRFVGTPSSIESISIGIGGQRFDKIFPSITGQFDEIPLLNLVVPLLSCHEMKLSVKFTEKHSPLEIYYDRVSFKKNPEAYEIVYKNTQSSGEESIQKGSGKVNLPYHHPIETVRVFSRAPLNNTRLVLNSVASLHVPYKGLKNGMHLYEISFHGTINFSRIDAPYFHFEATEDTVIYHFGIGFNIARFMNGMGGMAFSK